jgi:hypothetical protein
MRESTTFHMLGMPVLIAARQHSDHPTPALMRGVVAEDFDGGIGAHFGSIFTRS